MKTILIMGSTFDEPHAKKSTDKLDERDYCKANVQKRLISFHLLELF